ncbi:DEHYDRATION-INDUCED 19-like 6 [Spatholobus suberectus]|nr:DEHYDRATION-INDUCED 19-like 6 [Spatholobus suberectus]
MDLDFRASAIHSTNHFSSLQRLHSENYSVFSYTDEDDDARSLLRCPFCDFEIEFSSVRTRLEEVHRYDPKNMFCPVCDEKLGEDVIRVAQNSSSEKRTWKSDKSSISSGDSVVLDKKLPARGSKHEPVPDPLLSPFIHVSVPNSSGIHPGGGSASNASDISNAKGSGTDAPPDSGDEEDIKERRLRASFVQELVLSTLI